MALRILLYSSMFSEGGYQMTIMTHAMKISLSHLIIITCFFDAASLVSWPPCTNLLPEQLFISVFEIGVSYHYHCPYANDIFVSPVIMPRKSSSSNMSLYHHI